MPVQIYLRQPTGADEGKYTTKLSSLKVKQFVCRYKRGRHAEEIALQFQKINRIRPMACRVGATGWTSVGSGLAAG
jgi:hypothetical protein